MQVWTVLLGTTYIRDTVCISFCLNELLSIIENTTLMGIPYPPAIKKAIYVLQMKVGRMGSNVTLAINTVSFGFVSGFR
ncbi:MAG: phage holin family protein [Ruminococcus sp.]